MRSVFSRRHFGAGSAAAFASIAVVRSQARAAQFEWKYGNDLGGEHPLTVRAVEAFRKVYNETNGQLSIKSFRTACSGARSAMLTQVRSGALEMLALPGGRSTRGAAGCDQGLGYAFKDLPTAWAAFDGDLGASCARRSREGHHGGGQSVEPGFPNVESQKPIRTAEDSRA